MAIQKDLLDIQQVMKRSLWGDNGSGRCRGALSTGIAIWIKWLFICENCRGGWPNASCPS